jgi:hypothetical protein
LLVTEPPAGTSAADWDAEGDAPREAAPAARGPDERKEIASGLFERGKAKWEAGEIEAAAELLSASQQQLPRPPTLILLGDCYEQLGRLESAREAFHRAVELAGVSGDERYARAARTREGAVTPRVPRLQIRVPTPAPQSLSVTLNGVELPTSALNAPLPLDAGAYQLEAHAPGYLASLTSVRVSNGSAGSQDVHIVDVQLTPEPMPPPALLPVPAPTPPPDSATDLHHAGSAALVASGALMIASGAVYSASKATCKRESQGNPNACGPHGMNQRDTALTLADVATGFGVVGGIALASGALLYFTPVSNPTSAAPAGASLELQARF